VGRAINFASPPAPAGWRTPRWRRLCARAEGPLHAWDQLGALNSLRRPGALAKIPSRRSRPRLGGRAMGRGLHAGTEAGDRGGAVVQIRVRAGAICMTRFQCMWRRLRAGTERRCRRRIGIYGTAR